VSIAVSATENVAITKTAARIAAAQKPRAGRLNLDHVAHFVPNIDEASATFEALGFTLTPFSAQMNRLDAAGPLVAAGAGNRCIMLERGYIECLTPTADTTIAGQLREAIARYTGLHLIAFGTGDAAADHARLVREQFAPLAPVDLQRGIVTPDGDATARFTVVRVPPGGMAEGRIQFCQQHTPELLWQARWTKHANRAVALTAVIVCVENPREAAQRYARFTGIAASANGEDRALDTARGRVLLVSPQTIKRVFSIDAPVLPWIVGSVLASARMETTRKCIVETGLPHGMLGTERLYVVPPAAIGGLLVFEPRRMAALVLS
jgi:hypothetical protein